LAGKIRHDKKGKEEKRKMWSTPHQQTVQSQTNFLNWNRDLYYYIATI
jgi:hypothetical protein